MKFEKTFLKIINPFHFCREGQGGGRKGLQCLGSRISFLMYKAFLMKPLYMKERTKFRPF